MVGLLHTYSKLSQHAVDKPEELTINAGRSRRPPVEAPSVVMRTRQLRLEEIDAMVARYEVLGNVNAVAREFQLTRQTVARHLAARGIATVRRMTESDIAIAVERYAAGDSGEAIGMRLGFSAHTVLNAVRRAGVAIR